MKLTLTAMLFLTLLSLSTIGTDAAEPAIPALRTDIEFVKVGDVSLTLDAFVPEGAGPFPSCILVHGGGFIRGDKQSYIKPLFEPLSKAGFAWFTINYRLAPQHRWPACAEDVETAIRWVKGHAKEYKLDVGRIALIGESAGGHLVSWVGTRANEDTRVAAVVLHLDCNRTKVTQQKRQERTAPFSLRLTRVFFPNEKHARSQTSRALRARDSRAGVSQRSISS